jgi:hypothetical protein
MTTNLKCVFAMGVALELFAVGCNSSTTRAGSVLEAQLGNCPTFKCLSGGHSRRLHSQSVVAGDVCQLPPNGAVLDSVAFHELDADVGQAVDGLSITRFEDADKHPLTLIVDGDELTGVTASGKILRGSDLVNAYLFLVDSAGDTRYYLRIDSVGTTPFLTGDGGVTHTYYFYWRRIDLEGTTEEALCTPPVGDDWLGLDGKAFIFGSDHYDDIAKTVTVLDGTRFNVACAGTTFAKMHLLRHTTAGSDAAHTTTAYQRQALFKMMYANYCYTGREGGQSFTYIGFPVLATNAYGWFPSGGLNLTTVPNSDVSTIEAIWDASGAVCLEQPRMQGYAPVGGDPDILGQVRVACPKLPSCTELGKTLPSLLANWQEYGYVLSANPPPPTQCPPVD